MIVRILSSAATFSGLSYNTDKIENGKGELMKVENFGPLQALDNLRPEDYVNYLRMIASQNKRVAKPQFHAVISAKGKSHSGEQLTEIATGWLKEMGYQHQPYLMVFHKDTKNSHIHIVSVRIDKQGKKINSAFEHNRAIQNLNKVMGLDEHHKAGEDLAKALTYRFHTKSQFMLILESQGYQMTEKNGALQLIKFGKVLTSIPTADLQDKLGNKEIDTRRAVQITAIIDEYKKQHSTELLPMAIPLPGGFEKQLSGFTSPLAEFLREKFGWQFIFHSKDDKPAYGYTIIDHAKRNVFKGSEIMPLKQLLKPEILAESHTLLKTYSTKDDPATEIIIPDDPAKHYYATLLLACIKEYGPLRQSLERQGLHIYRSYDKIMLADTALGTGIDTAQLLSAEDHAALSRSVNESDLARKIVDFETHSPEINISISDDVDDEAIHGRNRRREKKARTNRR